MILLDTHVLVWSSEGDPRLGKRSRRLIEKAFREDEVAVSAFSFWEIAHLMSAGRIRGHRTADEYRAATLRVGIVEVPVDGEIAVLSTRLAMHGDPADRLIVATALLFHATLVTADEKLLALRGKPSRLDAQT